jgi:hypothetical protein
MAPGDGAVFWAGVWDIRRAFRFRFFNLGADQWVAAPSVLGSGVGFTWKHRQAVFVDCSLMPDAVLARCSLMPLAFWVHCGPVPGAQRALAYGPIRGSGGSQMRLWSLSF